MLVAIAVMSGQQQIQRHQTRQSRPVNGKPRAKQHRHSQVNETEMWRTRSVRLP